MSLVWIAYSHGDSLDVGRRVVLIFVKVLEVLLMVSCAMINFGNKVGATHTHTHMGAIENSLPSYPTAFWLAAPYVYTRGHVSRQQNVHAQEREREREKKKKQKQLIAKDRPTPW